jgi:hypothetical protein
VSDCAKSTLEIVQPWVTWGVVVAGWFFVYHTTGLRERRKEDALLVDRIEQDVEKLRDLAIDYYTTTSDLPADQAKASQIKLELRSLGHRLRILRARNPDVYDLDSELIAFRKAISGGDFETMTRAARPSAEVMPRVWAASDDFVTALNIALQQAHPATPFRRR